MFGIDLNKDIKYHHSSLRFFKANEHHVSRIFPEDVLLLVYDGILRFSEDGILHEVKAGQYYIQQRNLQQSGDLPSDSPQYLFVHFYAEWTDSVHSLPRSGEFDYAKLKSTIEDLDRLSHSKAPLILQTGKFYELLAELYQSAPPKHSIAGQMADFVAKEFQTITLEALCREFHFCKNHIINIFKKEFSSTPTAYINTIRLGKAEYWLETTSTPIEQIAGNCGFHNYSHFYRQFVCKNGISPEEFRRQKHIGILP